MAITITFTHSVASVLTNATTVLLSDPTGAFGIQRDDTGGTVVADATAFTNSSTGTYAYTLTEPAEGLTYTIWIEWVYKGRTHRVEHSETGSLSINTTYSQLGGMRALWREFTGLSETADITDALVNTRLNDFYQNTIVKEVPADDFQADETQATSITDDGEYTLATNLIDVREPVFYNGKPIVLVRDAATFWGKYPEDTEGYVTDPTLVIGTISAADVRNAAFNYEIGGYTYTAAAGESNLTGSTIPQDKYGAWQLTIDADATITVTAATDNGTGYPTEAKAVAGLASASGSTVIMGYVTVINTSGTFVPDTTLLSAAGVTDTFTDGDPKLRGIPEHLLVQGRTLFARPKPDDLGLIKFPMLLQRPTALSSDTSTVINEEYGTLIAMGDAIAYLMRLGNDNKANRLLGRVDVPGTYKYLLSSTQSERQDQETARVVYREF